MKKQNAKAYLRNFLKVAPLSHALWRATEALSFGQVELKQPVLDVGCGFGEFAGVVFDKVEVGIDVSASDLEKALKGKRYDKVQWADARALPFKSNSFRTVTSVSVLEHIERGNDVVAEVSRILKRGGIFTFSVPTVELRSNLLIPAVFKALGLKSFGDKYFDLHKRAFKHVNLKSKNWWEKVLLKNGFEIVKAEGTLSRKTLRLHEFFLLTALPSQFWKLFFGRRLIMSVGLRSNILPIFFSRYVFTDKDSEINMFFVAKKK